MSKLVSMEWDTCSITEEPITIADILEEEWEAIDDSSINEESTDSSEERSERSAAENESDTYASNSNEESDDAEDGCICIEDVCSCQAGEIRDILARLDTVSKELDDELDAISKELSDSEDEECLEVQAMVLADYTEEELADSESEDDMEQVANIEEIDVIREVVSGLGPQKTAEQKIQEWLEKMV